MPAGFRRLRGARAAGRQHGAASPACHSCLEGGGARRTPWPLCPSSGAGPHGRSAPEAARVPVSVPRGRCGDLEVRGRTAARLLRRSGCGSAGHVAAVPQAARAAWPHGSSGGAWPPCPPTGGAGRRSAASHSTRNEVRLRAHKPRAEGGAEARPGEPTPPASDIGRVGQCQRASNCKKKKKKKGEKRAITAARRRA
ncbi:hypothetical protein NDU88_003620 [Pleurodeles waltl]|uniref:Uncharacterized protein n=1 Tax=Pleurodeles waltl TaxID=8319 RepID=A0AAV7TR49_PLEWA|nr:hypothetical protein NDU88_003620 [Pleurodeles waltl]